HRDAPRQRPQTIYVDFSQADRILRTSFEPGRVLPGCSGGMAQPQNQRQRPPGPRRKHRPRGNPDFPGASRNKSELNPRAVSLKRHCRFATNVETMFLLAQENFDGLGQFFLLVHLALAVLAVGGILFSVRGHWLGLVLALPGTLISAVTTTSFLKGL